MKHIKQNFSLVHIQLTSTNQNFGSERCFRDDTAAVLGALSEWLQTSFGDAAISLRLAPKDNVPLAKQLTCVFNTTQPAATLAHAQKLAQEVGSGILITGKQLSHAEVVKWEKSLG